MLRSARLSQVEEPAPGDAGDRGPGLRLFLLVWLAALLLLAANHPGQLVFDTKLGVDTDPAGFLARLWPLWDPLEWLGTLQDQYVGYAIPMAPFYLVCHLAGVPAWLTERLWMSLLVATGFAGLARLAAALRIGSPRTRLLAGLAFALWPTFTILVGSTSASVLPGVLAPWAVLPLVRAARGETGVVRAAARSGVAVACMGGVNAVVTLEALIAPGLFILVCARGRRRVALAGCWAGAAALATAWWAGPLLLQGRYASSFLPYIEQAATTTRTMSAAAALTGAGNWTAYLNNGTPWLSAGWTMVSAAPAILASAAAAAAGLAGLARRDLPHAAWLRLCAGIAAAGALAGYYGPLGGPLHGEAGRLLDGTLAAFRNVYKLESVLALVLALGIAHCLARLPQLSAAWIRPAVAAAVLAGLALPYLTDQVLAPGAFGAVPGYWSRAAAYLAARSPRSSAFVVPGDAHGLYRWGSPVDDPLEPLASSPWVERGLVPFGGAGSQGFVNTAEAAVESGQRVPGLAAYLARAGVRYVVVRNDLSPAASDGVAPQVVHATLAASGLRRVAAFGPRAAVAASGPLPGAAYPAVEVYAVSRAPAVALLPASQAVLVSGGPGSLLQLAGQGVLRGRAAVLAGTPGLARPAARTVSYGLPRAGSALGLITATVSVPHSAAARVVSFGQLAGPARYPPLAREFRTGAAAPLVMTASARAVPGAALTALLARVAPPGPGFVQVTAPSLTPSPGPSRLLATPRPGPWIAATAHPVLRLAWTGRRSVGSLVLTPGRGAFPQRVTVSSPAGTRRAAVGFGGLVTLDPPLVTDQLSLSFGVTEPGSAAAAARRGTEPVALGGLTVPALAGLRPAVPSGRLSLPCGQGPALNLDGRRYATAVSGTVAALLDFGPVTVRLCAPPVLPAGPHVLTAAAPAPFAITSLTLGALPAPPRAARAVKVTAWADDARTLRVGPGPAAYLELHQNASPGWTATLHGRRLDPVVLDGWQQGYLVPAGQGGTVTLAFAPDAFYHLLLAAAALALLLLVLLALGPSRPAPVIPVTPARRMPPWPALAVLAALIFLAGGPAAAAVPALAALAWWRPRWLPAVAAAAIGAAGLITATAASPAALGQGAFSAPAQACALIALSAALMPALRDCPRISGGTGQG